MSNSITMLLVFPDHITNGPNRKESLQFTWLFIRKPVGWWGFRTQAPSLLELVEMGCISPDFAIFKNLLLFSTTFWKFWILNSHFLQQISASIYASKPLIFQSGFRFYFCFVLCICYRFPAYSLPQLPVLLVSLCILLYLQVCFVYSNLYFSFQCILLLSILFSSLFPHIKLAYSVFIFSMLHGQFC